MAMYSPIACPDLLIISPMFSGHQIFRLRLVVGAWLLLLVSPVHGQSSLLYDQEFPVIGYGSAHTSDAVSQLQERLNRGDLALQFDAERGYLDSVLEALEIDSSTQLLVFSKTSLQVDLISAATPRAIYFNDEAYVAWIPGAPALEFAAMDPNLGPVLYTLQQQETDQLIIERQMHLCLRCHDSFSMTGGGTPRFMMSSSYTGRMGQLISHEGHIMTTSRTPLSSRWGGWYVTGNHGDQLHLGNVIVDSATDLEPQNLAKAGNRTYLDDLLDTGPYITGKSDIVALLLIEHQVEVQNLISRVNFNAREALADEQREPAQVQREIESLSEELLRSMFMVGQEGLTSPISGESGFTEMFESLGPMDDRGRSLRELNLDTRLFEYPLSYLIYSEAFAGLPGPVEDVLFERINDVLLGRDSSRDFAHLNAEDRRAIREILSATADFEIETN